MNASSHFASSDLTRQHRQGHGPTGVPRVLPAWLALQGFTGIHARDADGNTPIMRAAAQGEERLVAALLACGVAADALNDQGNNALWFACLSGSVAVARRLLVAGVPVDHSNDEDITCAMLAAAGGRVEILKLLLARGADGDRCAPDGRTPRGMASERGLQLLRLARDTGRMRYTPTRWQAVHGAGSGS